MPRMCLLGAGGGGGVPASIAGLVLWLKADAIGGLANTDPVVTWEDSSSANNDADQGTAGNRPTYRTNVINGKPVVRFDGTDDYLQVDPELNTAEGDLTVIAVIRPTSVGGIETFYSEGSSTDDLQLRVARINGATPKAEAAHLNTAGDNITTIGTTTILDNTAYLVTAKWTATTQVIYLAGTQEDSDAFGSAPTVDRTAIGCLLRAAAGDFFGGDIAELIVYDSALSDANRGTVETYLTTKYAL